MAKPRVGILAPLKDWGGLERSFLILAQEFVRAGVIPEFVRIRGGAMPYPDSLPDEVRSVDLPTRSKIDGIPQVARYLRRTPPRALVTARDHSAQLAVLARRLARATVPVYVSATNMPSVVIRRPLQRWMARRLYPRADGVIAVSQGVADDVVRYLGVPRERVHLIYNPVVTRDFERRCRAAVDWPWPEDSPDIPVIISAGRLTAPKDFAALIDAFAHVRRSRRARLLILGEGGDREMLQRRVAAHGLTADIAMPGRVDDPVPYMHRGALFAFSSHYEGLGNVLVEAVASGTRIVATDCPSGPSEILEHGRHGRLVPPGDADALARAMDAALAGPRPSAPAVAQACERFSAPVVARQYLRLLGVEAHATSASEANG